MSGRSVFRTRRVSVATLPRIREALLARTASLLAKPGVGFGPHERISAMTRPSRGPTMDRALSTGTSIRGQLGGARGRDCGKEKYAAVALPRD